QPADRNGYILDTADPALVLTTTRDGFTVTGDRSVGVVGDRSVGVVGDRSVGVVNVDEADLSGFDDAPVTDFERVAPLRSSNTAYVIFTSGSTGRPKGVAVAHGSVVSLLGWMQADYPLAGVDRVLLKTPFTFDASVWELFWPLQVGASVVVAGRDAHRDPVELARVIGAESVSVAQFVPSVLEATVEYLDA
ncbi:AMP-binding protein, partial [Rhodococcus spongiicola]